MARRDWESMGPALWGFLAGIAVGAAVVALTTPKSGEEVREDLKSLGRRIGRKSGEMFDKATGAVRDLADGSREAWKA